MPTKENWKKWASALTAIVVAIGAVYTGLIDAAAAGDAIMQALQELFNMTSEPIPE